MSTLAPDFKPLQDDIKSTLLQAADEEVLSADEVKL